LRGALKRWLDTIAYIDHLASKRRHSLGVVTYAVVTGDAHICIANGFYLVHTVAIQRLVKRREKLVEHEHQR
jgi:hypothetical protein